MQKWSPVSSEINREEFLGISFSHHMEILQKTKDIQEILFFMRHKRYRCAGNIKGVKDAWESHLTEEGKKRYVIADPHCVVNVLRNNLDYTDLANYLEERYYRLSNS